MRVTRENLSACKAFVDFWDDHVIIPSVRVFYRHPSLQKKPLMVMCLMSDDFNVFKIHMMMKLVNMARKFGVMVEHQNSLFVLRNPRLQRSFGLAIVYKIALTAIDSVHYSRWRTVGFILLLGSRKKWQSDNLYSALHQKFPTSMWCSINTCSRVFMGRDELGGRMPKRHDNQLYPF